MFKPVIIEMLQFGQFDVYHCENDYDANCFIRRLDSTTCSLTNKYDDQYCTEYFDWNRLALIHLKGNVTQEQRLKQLEILGIHLGLYLYHPLSTLYIEADAASAMTTSIFFNWAKQGLLSEVNAWYIDSKYLLYLEPGTSLEGPMRPCEICRYLAESWLIGKSMVRPVPSKPVMVSSNLLAMPQKTSKSGSADDDDED